jgi:hypothetical protein
MPVVVGRRVRVFPGGEAELRYIMASYVLRILALLALPASLVVSPPAGAAEHAVPFRSSDAGVAQIVGASGDLIRTADRATGHGTHVGKYTLEGAETINLVTGAITDGQFTMTAADGSTLTGTYSGQAQPGLTGYDVSGPITGGTGRLSGATGFLTWHGEFDPATSRLSDRVVGQLSW